MKNRIGAVSSAAIICAILVFAGCTITEPSTVVESPAPTTATDNPDPAAAVENPEPVPTPPTTPEPPESSATPAPATETGRVDIVYFHRTQRCHSCLYAEDHIIATLETYFADEIANGTVSFTSLDIQDDANAVIAAEYGVYSSQLFITTIQGDHETTAEITEFWDYIDDDEGFAQMLISRVNAALESIG